MKLYKCGALLLFAALLAGCAGANSQSQTPENPYESLLLPEGVTMRMSAEEFGKAMGFEMDDSRVIEYAPAYLSSGDQYPSLRGMEEVPMNHACALDWIKYEFDDSRTQEFEDERFLNHVEFTVRDTIYPDQRTKEKHGDIAAEYEAVKAFLAEKFGEPVHEYDSPFELDSCTWDLPDEKVGIILSLQDITKPTSSAPGYLTVEYLNTDGYYSDWYER